jgi:hypothetical protein
MVPAESPSLPRALIVTGVTWTGPSILEGEVSAIHTHGPTVTGMRQGDGYWSSTRVEVEYVDFVAVPGVAGIVTDSGRQDHNLPGGVMDIHAAGAFVEVLFVPENPNPTMAMESTQGTLRIPSSPEIKFQSVTESVVGYAPQESLAANVAGSVQVVPDDGLVSLRGPLAFAMWNTELAMGDEVFWSGERPHPDNPGGLLELQQRRQVIYGTTTGGDTRIDISGQGSSLYIRDLVVAGSSVLELEAPRLPGRAGASLGNLLTLNGQSTIELVEVTADGFLVRILESESASLDGSAVSIAGPDAPGQVWIWASMIAIVLALAVGAVWLQRNSPSLLIKRLESHLHQQHYTWVATHAGPALRARRTGRRAALYKTTILLALGEFQEARLFLAALAPQQRPDPATYHFLTAHAAGGLGQHDVAARELQACLELEPSYQEDAEALDTLKEALRAIRGPSPRGSRDAYS